MIVKTVFFKVSMYVILKVVKIQLAMNFYLMIKVKNKFDFRKYITICKLIS